MMRNTTRSCLLTVAASAMLLTACGQTPEKAAEKETPSEGVRLTDEQAQNLGITTAPAKAIQHTAEIRGYGIVMGLDAMAQADAEIVTGQAAAAQSASALRRARSLASGEDAAISQEALDTAIRQAASDDAALGLAKRKAMAMFGQDAPWLSGEQRGAIMARLASGRSVLVRATFSLGSISAELPPVLRIAHINPGTKAAQPWEAHSLWNAPADATIPGRSLFALVENSDLAHNERVLVSVPQGAPETGVLVPSDAIVLSDNLAWCYVRAYDGSYVRRQIDLSSVVPGGYFLRQGIKAGDQIAVNGIGLLLARELNPSTEVGD